MLGVSATSPDLGEVRRGLRELDNSARWVRELGQSQRVIARDVAGWAQGEAQGLGGPFAHFAGAIKGQGGASGAKVAIAPDANATFWGARAHSGWYAQARYHDSVTAQHPPWIGNGWDVGVAGEGPYAINAAIAAHVDEIVAAYGDAVERVMAEALHYPATVSTF